MLGAASQIIAAHKIATTKEKRNAVVSSSGSDVRLWTNAHPSPESESTEPTLVNTTNIATSPKSLGSSILASTSITPSCTMWREAVSVAPQDDARAVRVPRLADAISASPTTQKLSERIACKLPFDPRAYPLIERRNRTTSTIAENAVRRAIILADGSVDEAPHLGRDREVHHMKQPR